MALENQVELTMNESVAGTTFSFKRDDKLVVGRDIHEDEAVKWVNGGRCRVTAGRLAGTENVAVEPPRIIGTPEKVTEPEDEPETRTIRRGRRG